MPSAMIVFYALSWRLGHKQQSCPQSYEWTPNSTFIIFLNSTPLTYSFLSFLLNLICHQNIKLNSSNAAYHQVNKIMALTSFLLHTFEKNKRNNLDLWVCCFYWIFNGQKLDYTKQLSYVVMSERYYVTTKNDLAILQSVPLWLGQSYVLLTQF